MFKIIIVINAYASIDLNVRRSITSPTYVHVNVIIAPVSNRVRGGYGRM